MAAKKYSAGAIFLQVVPVFANVQRAIEDEAKNIDRALGDQMERSGERAGERAGRAASENAAREIRKGRISEAMEAELRDSVDGMNRALGRVNTKNLGKRLRAEVKQMRAELEALGEIDIKVDDNLAVVSARVAALRKQIKEMEGRSRVFIGLDGMANVYRQLHTLEARLAGLDTTVNVDVDTRPAVRQMGSFERSIKKSMDRAAGHIRNSMHREVQRLRDELDYLGKLRVGIDIGANELRREVGEIMAELEALSKNDPEIDVRFEAGRAFSELGAFNEALDRVDGRRINVRADADTANAERKLRRLKDDGDRAANSFRSFNIILFAAAAGGPALVPVLGAIAGGLLALGPAAGVAAFGLGAVLVGFSGIGNAITALQNKQEQSATTAQTAARAQESAARSIANAQEGVEDAERSAARAAEDAAKRVADAREQAAEAIEAALERQKEAQEAYRDSINDVRDAEKALAQARADAAGTGDDLDFDIRTNNLALDQALLDSFDATVNFNAVNEDGSSTNAEQEQARIDREEALLRLEELRKKAKELAAEKKKWDKEGVNGTEQVQDAQDDLNDAIEAQRESYEDLRDAAKEVDQARADGAEMVRDAIEDQNETLADNARAIQDAKEALADAREAAADNVDAINSQQQAVDNAMNALGPAGRKFALFLFGMRSGFRDFRDDIQAAMLPSIQEAIESFLGSQNAGVVRDALVGLAAGFGEFVKALSQSFQGEAWGNFFGMLAEYGPQIEAAYGGAFISFMEALASMMTTAAPFALKFAEGFERMMGAFADWANSKEGADDLRGFIAYVEEVGPAVLDFFGSFAGAFSNLSKALAPYGAMLLGVITDVLDFIAGMDTDTLGAILAGVIAVIAASQTAYALMNLMYGAMALFGGGLIGTVGLIVLAVVGLGLAFGYLWKTNESFRNFFIKAWDEISGAVSSAWNDYLKPALMELWESFENLWNRVLKPFFVWLAPILLWYIKVSIPLLMRWWALLSKAIAWAINNIVIPALLIFGDIMKWLWEKVIEPVVDFIRDHWDEMTAAMKYAWDAILKPALNAIGAVMRWLWTKIFRPALTGIKKLWNGLMIGIKWTWNNILWPVFRAVGKVLWALFKGVFKVVLVAILALFKATFIGIKWVWNHVLKPVFGFIGEAAKWLWKKAIKPVLGWIGEGWDELMKGMKWVWNHVLKPVFDWIGDKALPKLEGAFDLAVKGIKKIWEGLKKVVGSPIKFVIDTIMNKGLIAGFNKVAKWVGQDGFDEIEIPKWMESYATGGVLPGYTPGKDVHSFVSPTGGRLNLSGGEAIIRPEATRVLGKSWVDSVNAAAMGGGINGVKRLFGAQSFATGGIMDPYPGAKRTTYAGHDGVDLNRPGDNGPDGLNGGVYPYYSATSGRVTTTGYSRGYGNAVFIQSPYGELVYGHSYDGSIRVRPGDSVRPGQALALVGNTGNSDGAHLHFGFPGGSYATALSLLNAAHGGVYTGKIGKAAKGGLPSVPGWIKDLIKHPVDTIKGWATSQFSKATDFIKDSPVFDIVKNVPTKLVGGMKDKVMDIIPGWAKKAAGVIGKGAGAIKNAATDDQSGAGQFSDDGGYATGGILPYNGTMKYDAGGYLPPGLTSVVNLTGKPEPVFTAEQHANMQAGGGQGGTIHYEPHFEGSDLKPEDVAGDLNFTFRKIRRGGKYEGTGS